ncbi:hypothetical protein K503DRAFT_785126 [Rhizopogon vinicolor AM-OR11-026]|uniref:Uncharacterized protein n=1 Tax=Rhizopogon vinicolor AM-OR11-026 TaxID=1314800 RepID=A0A1B7MRZ5_9AGAM|nr:hypothetical protein K503DRAFT_785126 [Rhizopogon vinicolor AM-OR11-026]
MREQAKRKRKGRFPITSYGVWMAMRNVWRSIFLMIAIVGWHDACSTPNALNVKGRSIDTMGLSPNDKTTCGMAIAFAIATTSTEFLVSDLSAALLDSRGTPRRRRAATPVILRDFVVDSQRSEDKSLPTHIWGQMLNAACQELWLLGLGPSATPTAEEASPSSQSRKTGNFEA